jgi:hypothetical protein
MKPFWKTYTFWISVCAWLISMGGQYSEAIPSPYGLVAANLVAVVYATMRCLQKRQAGIPWKGIFFTSEFIGSSATVLANFFESLKNLPTLSPKALAIVSAIVVGLGSLLHTLGGTVAGRATIPPNGESLGREGVPTTSTSEVVTKDEKIPVIESSKSLALSPPHPQTGKSRIESEKPLERKTT